jgi:ribosomal protein L29
MATEVYKHGRGKDCQQKNKEEMDKQLKEIRVEMDRLTAEDATGGTGTLEVRVAHEAKRNMAYLEVVVP